MDSNALNYRVNSRSQVELMARTYAESLEFSGNKFALLMAICGCESSFTADIRPRFELGYSRASLAFKRSDKLKESHRVWGDLAAMSYGPFQILHAVARDFGYSINDNPVNLQDAAVSMPYVIMLINHLIKRGALTVEQIGRCYNGGLGALRTPTEVTMRYSKKLKTYYDDISMPLIDKV